MIKWLLTAAAALLLLSSTVSAVAVGNETVSSSTTTNSLHHQNQLIPTPKNLGIINDRFEAIAQFTHSQLSKIPSNDDKDFDLQLAQTSLGGKHPEESPVPTPIKDLEQFQLNTDTPTSITDWPTFSPSSSPVTFMPTSDSPSLMPTASNPTPSPSIEPTTSAPTISSSTRQPSSFPVTSTPSFSPTSSIGNDDDINDTVNIEKDDECTKLSLKKCKKMKDVCEVVNASCKTIGAIPSDNYPTFYPTSAWPTDTPTDADDEILSSSPTLSILDAEVVTSHLHVNNEESYFPTYSPSEVSTKSPSGLISNKTSTSSNSTTSNHGRVCPQEFDTSVEYKGGDAVSIKRSRQCRVRRCHVEYQCKPWPESAYCNLIVPGKRSSDKGWLKLGRCFDASSGGIQLNSTTLEVEGQDQGNEENGEEDAASSPTGESSTGQVSSHHEEIEDGSLPTPSPLARDQTSPSPQDNEDDSQSIPIEETTDTEQAGTSDVDESIRIPLPRIIADITLSSSIVEEFEQKHILSEAMTNMIYNLFGIYISPSLYDLVGISLSVDKKKNSNYVDDAKTTRVHAYFDGEAIFSMIGAPAKSDLITLLIRYFDIDEFNQRLVTSVGGRRRLSSDQDSVVVKVNSVFFTLEDGSLVSAGTRDWEENKLPPSSTTLERESQLQVAFVLSALLGLACMSALIMFGIYYKRMKDEDDEELGAFPSALPSALPSAPRIGAAPISEALNLEEGSRVSEPLDTISEVAVNTSTESGVHIQIPATPGQAVSDLSQFASDGSEVSSFSYSPSNAAADSPAYDLGFISPPDTPMSSLNQGMTKNGRVAGSPSDLRVMSWAGDVSLGLKRHDPTLSNYHWEIYQQDSTMESV